MTRKSEPTALDFAVTRGEVYQTVKDKRLVRVDEIDFGGPCVSVRELVASGCPHDTMRTLNGGACPLGCAVALVPTGRPVNVQLTVHGTPRAWRLPSGYQPLTDQPSGC